MSARPFDISGPPGAPALVLLHGVTANRKIWLPHAPLLSRQYRVIALDLPGHGSLSGEPFRIDAAVELLARTIAGAAGGRALLVGDSLGGYVSISFADEHPQLLAGLVLASCTLEVRGVAGALARLGSQLMALGMAVPPVDAALARMAERELHQVAPPPIAGPILEAGIRTRARPEAFRELAGRDFRSMVRRFPGPVLILNGERDLAFRLGERRYLASARDCRLRVIGRANHTASLERPELFSAAIQEFASAIGW